MCLLLTKLLNVIFLYSEEAGNFDEMLGIH